MRRRSTLIAVASVALTLSACSKGGDVAANATAPAGFVPPTALNRTDFIGNVDRRFQTLDVNHDSKISQAELPLRNHDIIAGFDKDGDHAISKDEFTKGSLARFDKADGNQDEVLTGEERRSAGLGETSSEAARTDTPAGG
ncbi:hypothetical protein EAH87_05730 [Sphingomonas koreensis]|nr:hypothetical protein EAH87_05730 [Sphingomonas koreensis]